MYFKFMNRIETPDTFFDEGDVRTTLPIHMLQVLYVLQNVGVIDVADILDLEIGYTNGPTLVYPVVKFDVGFPSQESNCQMVIDGQFLTFSDISQMEVRFDIHHMAHIKDGLDGTVTRFLETLKKLYGDYPTARCNYPHP